MNTHKPYSMVSQVCVDISSLEFNKFKVQQGQMLPIIILPGTDTGFFKGEGKGGWYLEATESMGHDCKMLQFEDSNQTENCYTIKITMSVCQVISGIIFKIVNNFSI